MDQEIEPGHGGQIEQNEKAVKSMDNKIRIFISYSHKDMETVADIVKLLENNDLAPMWDKNFAYGHGFPEQIKNFIAHSHVFMPIITNDSITRGWVHQEIGYATALNVPVLPVTKDQNPGEMLLQIHAMQLSDKAENLEAQLSKAVFERLVTTAQRHAHPLYECAEYHEDRTIMMVEYATKVAELGTGYSGHVRQKGALSSFHIPDGNIGDPVWQLRYGKIPASIFLCRYLKRERQILEKHAKKCGYSIIIDPSLSFSKYGLKARQSRLGSLLNFLETDETSKDKVKIAINKGMDKGKNITIVGDWFLAESVSATLGKGYEQTIFTRNAASIRNKIAIFDQEVNDILKKNGIAPHESKAYAITEIKKILDDLKNAEKQKRHMKAPDHSNTKLKV